MISRWVGLFVLFSSAPAWAGGICGDIHGKVQLPSYRFRAVSEQGGALPRLPVTAALLTWEGRWEGDHWGEIPHRIPVAVTYDATDGVYVSSAFTFKVPTRWKGLNPACHDMLQGFRVFVNFPPKDQADFSAEHGYADFYYGFPSSGSSYQLPDAGTVHEIQVQELEAVRGRFIDYAHIQTDDGRIAQASWSGQPTHDGVPEAGSLGLTPGEMQLMKDSIASGAGLVSYGLSSQGVLRIQNIVQR
jgi:hypothetical protein